MVGCRKIMTRENHKRHWEQQNWSVSWLCCDLCGCIYFSNSEHNNYICDLLWKWEVDETDRKWTHLALQVSLCTFFFFFLPCQPRKILPIARVLEIQASWKKCNANIGNHFHFSKRILTLKKMAGAKELYWDGIKEWSS